MVIIIMIMLIFYFIFQRLFIQKQVPLAGLILGRDAGLVLAAFYYRYISLPKPVSRKFNIGGTNLIDHCLLMGTQENISAVF